MTDRYAVMDQIHSLDTEAVMSRHENEIDALKHAAKLNAELPGRYTVIECLPPPAPPTHPNSPRIMSVWAMPNNEYEINIRTDRFLCEGFTAKSRMYARIFLVGWYAHHGLSIQEANQEADKHLDNARRTGR